MSDFDLDLDDVLITGFSYRYQELLLTLDVPPDKRHVTTRYGLRFPYAWRCPLCGQLPGMLCHVRGKPGASGALREPHRRRLAGAPRAPLVSRQKH